MEMVQKLEKQSEALWKKALKILLGLGIFYLTVEVGLVMAGILSGWIGVTIYQILGFHAHFHYEIQWSLFSSYFSGVPLTDYVLPVTVARELITSVIFLCVCVAFWFCNRKQQKAWNLGIEFGLLFVGLFQLLLVINAICQPISNLALTCPPPFNSLV